MALQHIFANIAQFSAFSE